jgi:hypothetical protein
MRLTNDGRALRVWADSLDRLAENDGVPYGTAVKLAKAAGEIRLGSVYLSQEVIAAHEHLDLARAALDSVQQMETTAWVFDLVREAASVVLVTQRVWRGEMGETQPE